MKKKMQTMHSLPFFSDKATKKSFLMKFDKTIKV
jgi:hypothetical protein